MTEYVPKVGETVGVKCTVKAKALPDGVWVDLGLPDGADMGVGNDNVTPWHPPEQIEAWRNLERAVTTLLGTYGSVLNGLSGNPEAGLRTALRRCAGARGG